MTTEQQHVVDLIHRLNKAAEDQLGTPTRAFALRQDLREAANMLADLAAELSTKGAK